MIATLSFLRSVTREDIIPFYESGLGFGNVDEQDNILVLEKLLMAALPIHHGFSLHFNSPIISQIGSDFIHYVKPNKEDPRGILCLDRKSLVLTLTKCLNNHSY